MAVNRKEKTKTEILLLNFGTSTSVYRNFTMLLTSLLSTSVLSTSPSAEIATHLVTFAITEQDKCIFMFLLEPC
jgi:hypothetical protein